MTVPFHPSLSTMSDIDVQASKKRKMSQEPPVAPTDSLLIKRLSDKAKLPTKGSALAAGYDLYRCAFSCYRRAILNICSAENKVIPARGKAAVDTQISVAVPRGTYGRVAPRSGLGELSCAFSVTA